MLNPFPDLLALSFFAPLLLRVAVGVFFFLEAKRHAGDARAAGTKELRKWFRGFAPYAAAVIALTEASVALALVVGFFTQIAALVGVVVALTMFGLSNYAKHLAVHTGPTYLFAAVICFTLLLTGAGALAFDLPL